MSLIYLQGLLFDLGHKTLHRNRETQNQNLNNNVDKNLLTIRDLEFGYILHKPVLEGINLDVPKGRFLGLLGPSGSGKSTLLKIIIGLHRPWHGCIQYGSNKVNYTKTAGSNSALLKSYLVNPIKDSIRASFSSIGCSTDRKRRLELSSHSHRSSRNGSMESIWYLSLVW